MFGVKYGDLNKLVRRFKIDHELALELWQSGNFDARVLATMIANPDLMTMKTLQLWMKDVGGDSRTPVVSGAGIAMPFAGPNGAPPETKRPSIRPAARRDS